MSGIADAKRMLRKPAKQKPKMTWLATTPGAGGSFASSTNPLIAEYIRPENTQNPLPDKGETLVPFYVPAVANERLHAKVKPNGEVVEGSGEPMHVAELKSRREFLNDSIGRGKFRDANVAAVYKYYAYAWACLAITVVTALFVNVYLAAIPAFLAGTFWSEKQIGVAWGIQWFKGKTLVHPS
ncbi:MAG: hypothetical protein AB1626_03210 [Candidatus Micrarchaeota archaeon]